GEGRSLGHVARAGADPLQCLKARGDLFPEGADRRAAQRCDMPKALERAAEVAGERTHVGSLPALGNERGVIAVRRFDQFEPVNRDRAWRDIHHLAVAREAVGALARDFYRREARRPLHELAGAARQQRADGLAALALDAAL